MSEPAWLIRPPVASSLHQLNEEPMLYAILAYHVEDEVALVA